MTLYIIAGANGSGKTTFALSFSEFNHLAFINADEIAKELNPQHIEKEKIKAGRMFLAQIDELIEAGENLVLETTMSGKYLIRIIDKAKAKNYKIAIFYLYLDKVIDNIARVENRVRNGGHNIPKDDIIRRYSRSRKLFWDTYKQSADEWFIFFNSDDEFEEVANFADDEETILNEIYYDNFKKELK